MCLALLSELQLAHLWVLLYDTYIPERFAPTKEFKGALKPLHIISALKFEFANFCNRKTLPSKVPTVSGERMIISFSSCWKFTLAEDGEGDYYSS